MRPPFVECPNSHQHRVLRNKSSASAKKILSPAILGSAISSPRGLDAPQHLAAESGSQEKDFNSQTKRYILAFEMLTSAISDEDLKAVGVARCFLFSTIEDAPADNQLFGRTIRALWKPVSEQGTLELKVRGETVPLTVAWQKYRTESFPGRPVEAHIGTISRAGRRFRILERVLNIRQHSIGGTVFSGTFTASDGVCVDELIRATRTTMTQVLLSGQYLRFACRWVDDQVAYDELWFRRAVRLTLNPADTSGELVRIAFNDVSQ